MPIDYSKYPPNWKSEIRPRIMARAGNKCEFEGCGFEHLEHIWSILLNGQRQWFRYREDTLHLKYKDIKLVKVVITIAHLNHDEGNMDIQDDKLMAMCQLHHLRYDAEAKALRRTQT